MFKSRKLISLVLALALITSSLFVGSVTAMADTLFTTVNTYDEENTSYRTATSGGESCSYLTVDGVEDDWYRFATWGASVEKDTTKTGTEQNAVQFVKAAKLNYGWPAAVRIYDNNSGSVPHYKAKSNTTYQISLRYYAAAAPDKQVNIQVRQTNSVNIFTELTYDTANVLASEVATITAATDGWVEATATFTTDSNAGYLNITLCSATNTDANNVNIWIDDVILNECRTLTAHNYNGANETFVVTAGTKLSDIDMPSRDGFELEGVYADSIHTNKLSASDIISNYTDIYYNWVKVATKTLYCGFEDYTEQIAGISLNSAVASIVEDNSYVGAKALKLTLGNNGLTAFELRDSSHFDIINGKEYTVSFAYKSSANAKVSVGLAQAGNVVNTAQAITTTEISASEEWQTATVVLTTDKSSNDGYAMAMLVYADAATEVYIDDIKIKYTGEGSSSLDDIDFGFTTDSFPTLNVFTEEKNKDSEEGTGGETEPVIWDGSVAESFAGGSGTSTDPYLISNGAELALAITQSGTTTQTVTAEAGTETTETVNEPYFGSYYALTADIYLNDINAVNWLAGTKNDGYTVNSWYDYYNYDGKIRGEDFAGVIDGAGFTVYGLYFNNGIKLATSNNNNISSALIPRVASGFTVKVSNLGVDYAYIHHHYVAGVIVGGCASAVSISNSFVGENVKVAGRESASFVGNGNQKAMSLTNCYSLATYGLDEGAFRHGLVGYSYHSTLTVKNCYNLNGPITSQTNTDYSTYYKFYNSYQTKNNGTGASRSIYTNVVTTTADKMQGTNVFTDESKMPYLALNTDGTTNTAYTATKGYPVLTLWAPEPEAEISFDIWDGKTKTAPKDSNGDGVYEITNGAELAYIIANHGTMITGTETTTDETTGEEVTTNITADACSFILTNDIYLNDITKVNWETCDVAIGYTMNDWFNNTYFAGNINGNGYTVHGLYYGADALNAKSWTVSGVGLVPRVLHGATVNITNLGIDHAYINSKHGVSAFVGCAGTDNSNPSNKAEVTIENCYAGKNVTLVGHSVGVFRAAGRGSNTYIRNCYSLATTNAIGDYGLASMAWDAPITIEGSFNANGPLTTASSTVKNSYQTVAGKHSAVTSLANMQGSDVLTNASKMPLLNSEVFSAATKDFSQHDFYVYLPIGTVCENEIEAEYYNDLFIKLDESTVIADGVMLRGAYVKFAEEPDESKIIVPAEYKEFVRYGLKDELMLTNPWYGVKMDFITKNINEENSVKYAFITDIHYVGSEDVPRTLATMRQIENLVEYVNASDTIDFVAIGGDTIQGTQNKETSLGYFKKAFAPFLNCNKPVVIVPGNHDDNSYAYDTKKFNGSQVITDKEWNDNIIDVYVNRETANGDVLDVTVKQDESVENTKYFYYDLENKKTRIICLDSIDYEQTYDENGKLIVDAEGNVGLTLRDESKAVTNYMRYYMATTYWGYGARQMEWLAEEALQAGDDWDYIFISHMGIDEDTNFNTGADITHYGKNLREIIAAYRFKTPYVNEELGINADFSATKGEILSYQYGHTHRQDWLYSADVDLWQVNSDTAQRRDGFFDIMTVNKNAINRYNIGRGFDQTFVQTKSVSSGDLTNDGIVDICDAVKLRNIGTQGEPITTKADIDKDNTFTLAVDLAAIRNMLIS